MGSYARVTPGGTVLVQTGFVPPISLGGGERLSYIDRVQNPTTLEPFSDNERTASGTVYIIHTATPPEARIEIVGGSVEDVLKLRERMLERIGVKKVCTLPSLPNLADRWARLTWLLRWIWHGHTSTEVSEV